MLQRDVDVSAGTSGIDAIECVVSNNRVPDVQVEAAGFVNGNPVAGVEPEDYAIFDVHCFGLQDVDAIYPVTETVDG